MVKKMTAMLLRYDYNGEYYIITKMSRAFFHRMALNLELTGMVPCHSVLVILLQYLLNHPLCLFPIKTL